MPCFEVILCKNRGMSLSNIVTLFFFSSSFEPRYSNKGKTVYFYRLNMYKEFLFSERCKHISVFLRFWNKIPAGKVSPMSILYCQVPRIQSQHQSAVVGDTVFFPQVPVLFTSKGNTYYRINLDIMHELQVRSTLTED